MTRPNWDNCLVHFDDEAMSVLTEYFGRPDRHCLLIAGAGFDPRATYVAQAIAPVMKDRLEALLIREERGIAADNLKSAGDSSESTLVALIPKSQVERIDIFSSVDQAPVGGPRIVDILRKRSWPKELTDIILDVSALSIGISFPVARFLIDTFEDKEVNVHIVIASDPDLDAQIRKEPSSKPIFVKGFLGENATSSPLAPAQIWLPHLANDSELSLRTIYVDLGDIYKICPILPFPARWPRRPDDLIAEYSEILLDEWEISARDFLYVSEWNPLDSYRALKTLKKRYVRTVENVYAPRIVISPIGSKVMAIGAMMAAIECEMSVKYIETIRYEVISQEPLRSNTANIKLVHIWADGPVYSGLKSRSVKL